MENTLPETRCQKPSLWDHLLASYKEEGPASPTVSCNLLLVAGGRFHTDHALRLPWASLQDVSIRGGCAQIVAGAASHLPSSRGARTHEDDYNETEEPHMLAIINQHGSAEFLHKALLVCAAFAFFFLTSPLSAIFYLGMSLKITISPSSLRNSFPFFLGRWNEH